MAELIRTKGEDDNVVERRIATLLFAMRVRHVVERRLWLSKALVQTAWKWARPRMQKIATRIVVFETRLFDKLKRKEKKNADSADHHND